jgi:hypothetical protein
MAAQSNVDVAPPNPAQVSKASMMGSASRISPSAGPSAVGPVNFHFSPQINVPAGADMGPINQGLQASYTEWMRMMERYIHDQRRRSYGPSHQGGV